MMNTSQQQEQFSRAYVRAVATVAGLGLYEPDVDDDSVDVGFAERGGRGSLRSPRLEAQLKCTFTDVRRDEDIRYPLKLKNYDELRLPSHIPRVLVVVLIPEEVSAWVEQTEEQMILRRCGYWVSLLGSPAVDNETKVTVRLPRKNMLTPAALRALMDQIGQGVSP